MIGIHASSVACSVSGRDLDRNRICVPTQNDLESQRQTAGLFLRQLSFRIPTRTVHGYAALIGLGNWGPPRTFPTPWRSWTSLNRQCISRSRAPHAPALLDVAGIHETAMKLLTNFESGEVNPQLIETYAEIMIDREILAVFLLGRDDGCELWLNREKLFETGSSRSLTADGDRIEAALKAGSNKVLFKVLQGVAGWQFCPRVTDREGRPLDLSRQRILYDAVYFL